MTWEWTVGWTVGFSVGSAILFVVVGLLVMMNTLAGRVADEAERIEGALRAAERSTAALWDVRETRDAAGRMLEGARAIGVALEDDRVRS